MKKLITLALVACFVCTISIGCAAKSTSKPLDTGARTPPPAGGTPSTPAATPK